jgi:hypothetical protein
MSTSILICSSNKDLTTLMSAHALRATANRIPNRPSHRSASKPQPKLKIERDAESAQLLLTEKPLNLELAIIDARLPPHRGSSADYTGKAALELARWLKGNCKKPPIMIVTEQTPAPPAIDSYCTPDNRAIALPLTQQNSFSRVFDALLNMLREEPIMTWNTIEITVQGKTAICHIGAPSETPIEWGQSEAGRLSELADLFEGWQKLPKNWLRDFRFHGLQLFDNLIKAPLGAGFFAHIERAAGSVSRLAFRFKLEEAGLHAAPFEALGLPDEYDTKRSPFIILYAPVVRQVNCAIVQPPVRSKPLPRPARMLFVRSQVAENANGIVESDSVDLPIPNPLTGLSTTESYPFRPLQNIDEELRYLRKLTSQLTKNELTITELDLSAPEHASDSAAALTHALEEQRDDKEGQYDIVHFAGHSKTIGFGPDGNTFLILPGATVGEAVMFPVENFARAAGQSRVRLVYLSSCEGSSARSVASLVRHGVSHVVGFRWDVEDHRAAMFAGAFYTHLFKGPRTVCAAFRAACDNARSLLKDENDSAIWASPILIAQTKDWLVSPFTPQPRATRRSPPHSSVVVAST